MSPSQTPRAVSASMQVPMGATRRMLEIMYESFAPAGEWPTFQQVSLRLWREQRIDAREVYLGLAERHLVNPAVARNHQFHLREDTVVSVNLRGLLHLRPATDDVSRFVSVVRYVADRAQRFQPSSATELERPTITSGEIRLHLGLEPGAPALSRQRALVRDEAWQLRSSFSESGSGGWTLEVDLERACRYADIRTISDFFDRSNVDLQGQQLLPAPRAPDSARASDSRKVMVVHGRDVKARNDLFNLLRAFGLEPIEWAAAVRSTGSATPYNAEAVEAAFRTAHAAVILLVPEEQVLLRSDLHDPEQPADSLTAWQPRPNVFYEGGIAFTSHPNRTVMLELGCPRVASDLAGRNTVRITSDPAWRQELANRLSDAGCPISTRGSDWLTVGMFSEPNLGG